jgi:hypothetical protein
MIRLITILFAILINASVLAQAPNKMSYQAVVRDNSNTLVIDQEVGMRISILQTSVNGSAVYVETQMPTTNSNGLASIEIGSGIVVTGIFENINWANGPYFIKTETDPTGGNNYTITATSQLLSVPYALYAANAGTANGGGNFTHYIGEQFGGGVIFHLWKDAQGVEHGFIVDKTELSTSQIWSNITTDLIGSTAQSTWDGLSNSNAIVAQAGHISSAASLCINSTNGGQSDWYLPSVDEMSLLWDNHFRVNRTLSTIAGATGMLYSFDYWTSSEIMDDIVWYFNFNYNTGGNAGSKINIFHVRAIRAF